jgi:hypothetical protein
MRDNTSPGIDRRLAVHHEEGFVKAKFNYVDLD